MQRVIECPKCRQRLRVAEDAAGKEKHCPKCKASFRIPAAAAFVDDDEFEEVLSTLPEVDMESTSPNPIAFRTLRQLEMMTEHLFFIRKHTHTISVIMMIYFVLFLIAVVIMFMSGLARS